MNASPRYKALLFAAVCAVLAPLPAAAQAVAGQVIVVERGTHKLLRETGPVSRVAVGDPAIADVSLINRRELLIVGKAAGVTSLIVWPQSAASRQFSVKVVPARDPQRAARNDAELAKAQIDPGKSLEGSLPNLLAHRRARIAASEGAKEPVSDSSTVDTETQVMTEVKIAEVNRDTLKQFGFNAFKATGNSANGLFSSGSLAGVEFNTDPTRNRAEFLSSLPLQNAFNIAVGNPNKGLLGMLSILQRKGMARVLAEPTLLATSGQTANYLAGGEFPVPVSQGGSSSGGGITIEYKEFGVRLALSPTVLARDRIALKVAPEVSDLDFSAGIQIGGVAVPALTVRRTDTSIELGDGESFVISGLISSNLLNSVGKVPWLGDLPVLGAFFRSTSVSRQEKELIMVVTPHLVRPIARGAARPKLPGAEYDGYDPSFARTMLLENGKFETGFSR